MQRIDHRLPSATQLAEWLGKYRSWIYRQVQAGTFLQPRPVKFGGSKRWLGANIVILLARTSETVGTDDHDTANTLEAGS